MNDRPETRSLSLVMLIGIGLAVGTALALTCSPAHAQEEAPALGCRELVQAPPSKVIKTQLSGLAGFLEKLTDRPCLRRALAVVHQSAVSQCLAGTFDPEAHQEALQRAFELCIRGDLR